VLLYNNVSTLYFPAYFFFFSLLIITLRTDLEEFAILPHVLYAVPLGWIASFFKFLPITALESIIASVGAYALLWATQFLFLKLRKKEGLGDGDLDLLAFIGAFTGIIGVWITLLLGSVLGAFTILFHALLHKNKNLLQAPIPFGPFLALGAVLYVLYKNFFLQQLIYL
jgi:leader peptidase (prepilin peptidase)/N-methyltransferase